MVRMSSANYSIAKYLCQIGTTESQRAQLSEAYIRYTVVAYNMHTEQYNLQSTGRGAS